MPYTFPQLRDLVHMIRTNCTRERLLLLIEYIAGQDDGERRTADIQAVKSELDWVEAEAKLEAMPKVVEAVKALRAELTP